MFSGHRIPFLTRFTSHKISFTAPIAASLCLSVFVSLSLFFFLDESAMIIPFKMPLSLAKIIGQGKIMGEVGLDNEARKLRNMKLC